MAKKAFDLDAYKKTIKVADTPLKPDSFVALDDCLHSVLGMDGFPLSHVTQIYGLSDTGKTSLLFHAAAMCQQQGILPVVIITEGKVDWPRAAAMGFDKMNGAIVNEDCEFLENAFDFIDKICADVAQGDLPYDVMIFWDSVGNTLSKDEVAIQKDGTWEKKSTMMKAAKVITERMRVISKKINDTRKISYPKSVGLCILNQAYKEPPSFPGGKPKLVPYGGNGIWFRSSLVLRTQKVSKLTAKKDGNALGFGMISKITVDKNHLTNTAHSGEFVITANTIFPNTKSNIAAYKDEHKDTWGNAELVETDVEIKENDDEQN